MEEMVVNGRGNPMRVGVKSHWGSNDSQTSFRPEQLEDSRMGVK